MKSIFHLNLYHAPAACQNADIPHTHDYHELLFCTAGEGGQLAGRREMTLRAGDLFFYPAGMRHCSIFVPQQRFDCYVLDFQTWMFTPAMSADKEILDVVDKMSQFQGQVPILPTTATQIRQILGELLQEFREKNDAYQAVLKVKAMQLFIAIARDEKFRSQGSRLSHAPSHEDMVREVIHYLDAFYMNPITIDSVLEFCPLSRSHFHMVFKKLTGKTLIEYLTSVRLVKATQSLASTDATISEIAALTGFKTPSYFGQTFRTKMGLSPGEYRRQLDQPNQVRLGYSRP